MKVPGSKIVPCQGVLGSNHSLTFGLFTQVSGSGPLGPLVIEFQCLIPLLSNDNAYTNQTYLNLYVHCSAPDETR